jgi:hypothetical protein
LQRQLPKCDFRVKTQRRQCRAARRKHRGYQAGSVESAGCAPRCLTIEEHAAQARHAPQQLLDVVAM